MNTHLHTFKIPVKHTYPKLWIKDTTNLFKMKRQHLSNSVEQHLIDTSKMEIHKSGINQDLCKADGTEK